MFLEGKLVLLELHKTTSGAGAGVAGETAGANPVTSFLSMNIACEEVGDMEAEADQLWSQWPKGGQ